ncbi:MFS transporter [Levilactobacillus fujinensis]|uniref:MFS transporter n=1 Tax=Levilactobacillus fujinensis TaxID=2486024 RepID=A0ABW1TI03_9LACO|nr:MFS transporter [Levilactobacillus fujinensis]
MIVNLAPALGPRVGGLMVTWGGWQFIFLTTLPIVLLTWILGRRTLKHFSHPGQPLKFQTRQFFLLITIFLIFNFALGQIKDDWLHILIVLTLICICGGLLGQFNRLRQHDSTNLLDLSLLKRPAVKATFLLYTMIQLINLAVSLVIPTIVQLGQQVNALNSGLILLPGSLLVALINPWFGKLYDHFGGQLPICSGLVAMLSGLIGLTLCARRHQLTGIVFFFIIFSIGRTMSFGNTLTTAMQRVPQSVQPDLNALYSTGQQLAGSLGTTFGATLLAVPFRTNGHTAIMLNGQLVFSLLAILMAGMTWLGFRIFHQSHVDNH